MIKCIKRFWVRLYSCYMLKKNEKYAFGLPFYIHFYMSKKKREGLKQFKDIHKGERCFIIGTGPSLTIDDVRKLEHEYTFGVNTLFHMFGELGWQTSYYCIIDPRTYGNIKREFCEANVQALFYAGNRILDKNVPGIPFELECSDFYKLKAPDVFQFTNFSKNLDEFVYDGASVVYVAMEIAAYMGFKEIVLLGTDCNYGTVQKVHNESLNYKNYDYKWTSNTALTMIEGFKVAKEFAEANNIQIYNATRGGMLEVFQRVNLDDYLKTDF